MRAGSVLAGLLLLASCDLFPEPGPNPQARPADLDTSARVAEPSARSIELQQYYARLQRSFQTRGLSRTDGGGFDTPYTNADVARNFERIAFFDEFEVGQGLKRASGEPGRMAKWTGPVRIAVEFGAHTTLEQREVIPGLVAGYAQRLSRITGHPISTTSANANMHVLVAGIDDKDDTIARFRELEPNLSEASINIVRNLSRKTLCFVVTFSEPAAESKIYKGIVLIRAELPEPMVQGCVHEELAQGLGLRNDSAQARPSIFNDDEEFALLTSHDEELLRLLYHPSLKPGMTLNQARPLIKRILEGQPGQI
ncbi:MAG: DUF2927 domain-containing protein [Pseudomonadota bacterium]